MNVAILQTASRGSQSVPNKNILEFNGLPLFLHNIMHVKKSKYQPSIYMSTDIPHLKELAKKHNFKIINRPEELAGSNSSHHEVMRHGVTEIEKIENKRIDILVVILGNTISAWHEDVDRGINILISNNDVDSVISVGKYNMFNPMRSLSISDDGSLSRVVEMNKLNNSVQNNNVNDKDVVGDVYYLNGSFMIMRRSAIFGESDMLPFPWLGNKTIPIVQNPICMEIDAEWQVNIVEKISMDYSVAR